jgi:predicted phosphodiesterase
MTRIALISDIHANDFALRAVLADIRRVGVDQTICLGDVVDLGPEPNAVIDILAEVNCPCILGNHDEFMLKPELVHGYNPSPALVASADWTRDRLSACELEFLQGFDRQRAIALDGKAGLHVFHGSPRSHMENILATTPAESVDEMLADQAATVMAGGHTHIQMLRQHRGYLLVNPGSVGLAFKEYVSVGSPTVLGHAEYATVESRGGAVEVTLRRVPLDREKLRRAQSNSGHPLREFMLQQYS